MIRLVLITNGNWLLQPPLMKSSAHDEPHLEMRLRCRHLIMLETVRFQLGAELYMYSALL